MLAKCPPKHLVATRCFISPYQLNQIYIHYSSMLQMFNIFVERSCTITTPINDKPSNIYTSKHEPPGSSIILMLLISSSCYPNTACRKLSSSFISLVSPNIISVFPKYFVCKSNCRTFIHSSVSFFPQGIHYDCHDMPSLSTGDIYLFFYPSSLST